MISALYKYLPLYDTTVKQRTYGGEYCMVVKPVDDDKSIVRFSDSTEMEVLDCELSEVYFCGGEVVVKSEGC